MKCDHSLLKSNQFVLERKSLYEMIRIKSGYRTARHEEDGREPATESELHPDAAADNGVKKFHPTPKGKVTHHS